MTLFLRYYVRTLPNGKPVHCPGDRGILMELYFTTIKKLTGLEKEAAREILQSGRPIRTSKCEFWMSSMRDSVIQFQARNRR